MNRRYRGPCASLYRWSGKKHAPNEPDDQASGRSRREFLQRFIILRDNLGHPLQFQVTSGQAHESTVTLIDTLLIGADVTHHDSQGQPVAGPVALDGAKEYQADWFDEYGIGLGIEPVIPSRDNEDRDARSVNFNM